MEIPFIHNHISTATKNVPTLADIWAEHQNKQNKSNVKTASNGQNSAVKTAGKGELPDFIKEKMKKKKDGKDMSEDKEEKECEAKAKTKVAEKDEAESSGQLEPKANPNNEPKSEESSGGGSGGKKKSDEAESSGQLDVEPLNQKGESTGEKPGSLDTQKGKQAANKGKFVAIAALSNKQKEFLRRVWSTYWPKEFIDAILQ